MTSTDRTRRWRIGLAVVLQAAGMPASCGAVVRDDHPLVYVDEDACPFECCTYRQWTATRDTTLHVEPKVGARAVGNIRAGEMALAMTGKVFTTPARFIVKRNHEMHHAGESFWVYTYLGEGYFKIWRDGRMQQEALDFSPYGGTGGDRCQESTRWCWGELDRPLKMAWWILLRDARGAEGWSSEHENFDGADSCG